MPPNSIHHASVKAYEIGELVIAPVLLAAPLTLQTLPLPGTSQSHATHWSSCLQLPRSQRWVPLLLFQEKTQYLQEHPHKVVSGLLEGVANTAEQR